MLRAPGSVLGAQQVRKPGIVSDRATQGANGEATAEWVRLFERELEILRRRSDCCASVEARLQALESGAIADAHGCSTDDLAELAELMLSELRGLQAEVRLFQGSNTTVPSADPRLHGSCSPASAASRQQDSAIRSVGQRYAESQDRLDQLERLAARATMRLERLEAELATGDGEHGASAEAVEEVGLEQHGVQRSEGTLAARFARLEGEVQVCLDPLRRRAVSLRALEETSAKVEELQRAVAAISIDSVVGQATRAAPELEEKARKACGSLSLFDAYRVQAGVEQVMIAIEALTRQRNDDVRLMNSYLAEVYDRVDRDVPKDGSHSSAASLRAELGDLSTKVEGLVGVQLQELEARVLHETQVASEDAAACHSQLTEVREVITRALAKSADMDARLKGLSDASERHAAVEVRSESVALDIQRDMARLRVEIAELAAGLRGGASIEAEARLMSVRAELEAQMDRQVQEAGRQAEMLEGEIQALKRRDHELETATGSAGVLREDIERVLRDLAALRSETARADIELRERVAQGERELRAEIRAAQCLILELAEQFRSRQPIPACERTSHSALLDAHVPQLQDTQDRQASRSPQSQEGQEPGVGSVAALADGIVEWRVPGVRVRARAGDLRVLVSPAFSVPRLSGSLALRLKLFPLGSRRRAGVGQCSLYVSGPEGVRMQFLLRLGAVEHGPLECVFDRPDKDTGRHDFCSLEDELEVDGSSVVRLTVLHIAADF